MGYALDDASLRTILAGVDLDASATLNVHEFLATLAILHVLKARPAWPAERRWRGPAAA